MPFRVVSSENNGPQLAFEILRTTLLSSMDAEDIATSRRAAKDFDTE